MERVEDGYAVFMVCHSFPSRILLRDYLRAQLTGDSFLEVLTQDDCISFVWGSNMTMNEKKQEIEWRLSRRYGLQITLCDNLTMWSNQYATLRFV